MQSHTDSFDRLWQACALVGTCSCSALVEDGAYDSMAASVKVLMQVRPVMVTGDSAQCAHYIGRACGMVAEGADLLLGDVDAGGDVAWSLMATHTQDIKLQSTLTTAQVCTTEPCGGVAGWCSTMKGSHSFPLATHRLHVLLYMLCSASNGSIT